MKGKTFLALAVLLAIVIGNAEAGWKFWKKNKETTTTSTVAPTSSTAGSVTPAPSAVTPATPKNTHTAIAGAGDPGLAVGVGSTGGTIRNNAQPHRPNPGTEVGLDISAPLPGRPGVGGNRDGQGYRDWAVDLTGAGEPGRQPPKLPSQGPALSPGNRPGSPTSNVPQPSSGSQGGISQPTRPGQPSQPAQPAQPAQPSQPTRPGQPIQPNQPGQPSQPAQPVRPGQPSQPSQPGQPAQPAQPAQPVRPGQVAQPNQGNTQTGGNQVSTLYVTLKPGVSPTPLPPRSDQNRPGSPTSPGSPSSPTGGRTWADVAGGGSRSGSPTPAPRQPAGQPAGQPASGQQQPTRPSIGTGTAVAGGALAGGAAIGGALAGSGGTGNKVYSSNPTYSKGNTVTDEDLEKLSESLFIKDTNNVNRYITLNLQKKTSPTSQIDEAPQPLMTVNPEALQIPTVQKVLTIFDNYNLDTRTNEYISPAQRQEESLLVDTFLSTNVMSAAMRFLADKGYVRKDYYEYKDTLRRIWFNLFSRGEGKIGSSGFEHVFMTELAPAADGGTELIGLHNWIYYSIEESKRRADYLGYIDKIDLGNKASIVKIHTKFDGHIKPVTSIFVGTSPELEMALYTVCFFTREGQDCPVSLGGRRFNIMTHKFRYRGKDLIGTAYPNI